MRVLFLFFAVVSMIVATQAFAADPQPTGQTTPNIAQQVPVAQQPVAIRRIECKVEGAGEFPSSIQIHNTGNAMIPKGWVVDWSLPNTSRKGKYTLLADLLVNGYVMASNQLPGGHPGGAIVTCSVAEPPAFSPAKAPRVTRTVSPLPIVMFDCVVQGNPTEFPDDIMITNKGASTVAKGKTFHWTIPNTSRQGDWVLPEDLLAGKSVFASGVVGGGHPAGAKCTATLK